MKFVLLLCLPLLWFAADSPAKTLRWTSNNDYQTADPHAQNTGLNNNLNEQVYEALVTRGKKLEIVPQLATSWKQTSPNVWIFNLRQGVKFHDGTPFTADDAVFSLLRLQGPTSTFRVYALSVGKPRKIDDYTLELTTAQPNSTTCSSV